MSKKNKKKDKKPEEVIQELPVMPLPPGFHTNASGIMILEGGFEGKVITPIIRQIYEYNLMPEEQQPDRLTLVINSPGGLISSAMHLIDTMKMSSIPITTLGTGLVASCGVLTLMAGDRRLVTHNTSIMSHQFAGGSIGKEHELLARVKEFEMMGERLVRHYVKCTGKTEKYVRKNLLHHTDEWMTPEECLKHGIVDEVVETY